MNLFLVWQSFIGQTVKDGGEEAARSAMPQAAREWLAAEGDAEQERLYFARWFGYHDLGLDP
jgi:hypothetical protein